MSHDHRADAEARRLEEDARRDKNWKRWGPYLSERQWATVREDYSPDGSLWDYFPHEHARSRAYACWRVYKISGENGDRDVAFLERAFQKLLLNFTWWVNRKDLTGRNVFSGGFLGLDNIGVFDRSRPLPTGGRAALRGRPALAGSGAVLRILPRGHRAGAGGEPPDRLDRAHRPPVRGLCTEAGRSGIGQFVRRIANHVAQPLRPTRAPGIYSALPVLSIGGEKANGAALGQQIRVVASNATVVVLKNTGHWVLEENPKETTDALMNFLRDL